MARTAQHILEQLIGNLASQLAVVQAENDALKERIQTWEQTKTAATAPTALGELPSIHSVR